MQETLVQFLDRVEGFPGSSADKESACSAGDPGLIAWWGRSPGEGKGYPLQYSGLGNSMAGPLCLARGGPQPPLLRFLAHPAPGPMARLTAVSSCVARGRA